MCARLFWWTVELVWILNHWSIIHLRVPCLHCDLPAIDGSVGVTCTHVVNVVGQYWLSVDRASSLCKDTQRRDPNLVC